MTAAIVVPPEMAVPRFRYWGDRQPPKNRADVFSVRTAKAATGDSGTSTTPVGSTATLRLYGPIDSWGGYWGISAKDVAEALDGLPSDVSEVRVRINSPGGEVWEGLAILNLLRAHRARITAVVDGLAASAASVIAVGCDETVMSPGTQMMIHDASAFAYGPAETMAKAKKFLDSVSNSIAPIYSDAAGGTDEAWRALMVEETWYTAKEAVDAGLADSVAVVSDAGETSTAGEEPEVIEVAVIQPDDAFDLSIYNYAGRAKAPTPKLPTASAGGETHTQGGSAVAFSDEQLTTLRAKLELPETADEAAIVAAVNAVVEDSLEERPADTTTSEVPKGHVVIPAAKLADLEAGAALATTTAKNLHDQARDTFLDSVKDKYLPTSRSGWEAEYDRDQAGVRAHFEKAPVLIPTSELGHDKPVSALQTEEDAAYAAAFPETQKEA